LRRFTSSGKLPAKPMAESSSRNSSAVATMASCCSEMLRLLDHFTADEMVSNIVHLEQFK
jgi:hypothetical protein